jgi:hypothetical protein
MFERSRSAGSPERSDSSSASERSATAVEIEDSL